LRFLARRRRDDPARWLAVFQADALVIEADFDPALGQIRKPRAKRDVRFSVSRLSTRLVKTARLPPTGRAAALPVARKSKAIPFY
jgi:hypothetical protein